MPFRPCPRRSQRRREGVGLDAEQVELDFQRGGREDEGPDGGEEGVAFADEGVDVLEEEKDRARDAEEGLDVLASDWAEGENRRIGGGGEGRAGCVGRA